MTETGPTLPVEGESSAQSQDTPGWASTLQVVTVSTARCRVPGWSGSVQVTITEAEPRLHVYEAGSGEDMYPTGVFLAAMGGAPPWWPVVAQVQQVLERCPDVPVGKLLAFVSSSQAKRRLVAESSGADTPVWLGWALAGDPVDKHARTWVNRLPRGVPEFEEMLLHLAKNDDRLRIPAINRMADDLSMIRDAIDRGTLSDLVWVIGNPNTPTDWWPEVAEAALGHEYASLRLVRDRVLDEPTARVLLGSAFPSVRRGVARNEGTPETVWRGLLDDHDPEVAKIAWQWAWGAWPVKDRKGPEYQSFRDAYYQWRHVTFGDPLPDPNYDGGGQY